jgi:pantetheine-phosphate adenylyltransferase
MKIGVYPGTFDPITNGHTDLITRSLQVFDKVIVAIALNPSKHPLFDLTDRVDMVRVATKNVSNVEVEPFSGLLVDYVRERGARAVIRGLRAISDFEYELQMALINRKLDQGFETVFFMPSEEYSYLTSSIIKEVASLGGALNDFVHPEVAIRLRDRFRRNTP